MTEGRGIYFDLETFELLLILIRYFWFIPVKRSQHFDIIVKYIQDLLIYEKVSLKLLATEPQAVPILRVNHHVFVFWHFVNAEPLR